MNKIIFGVTAVAIVLLLPIYLVAYYSSCQPVSFTVEEKERVQYQESSKYLVFTDVEVFENTDDLLKFKFNSSDVYRDLRVGGQYTYEACGWRIPFLSSYRNLIGQK